MSSVIHFTDEFKTLINILQERSFKLSYCREVFYLAKKVSSSAVHPMVSFSEQVVKSINKKTITYGKFGIGLKKAWVHKMKLHPVLYLDRDSYLANALADLLKARRKKATVELASHVRLSIMTIKCFTKNAIGYNSYFDVENFNFKAEKEWRYVPQKSEIGNNLISQSKRLYEQNQEYYNKKLINFPLKFLFSDIEHIFVETVKQRRELVASFGISRDLIKISKWKIQ